MLFDDHTCRETISILEAAFLETSEGACISLGTGSLFAALGVFVVGVLVMQWLARRALAGLLRPRKHISLDTESPDDASPFDVEYDGGPIQSSKGFWDR